MEKEVELKLNIKCYKDDDYYDYYEYEGYCEDLDIKIVDIDKINNQMILGNVNNFYFYDLNTFNKKK